MLCPKCNGSTKVIDSRDIEDGKETRRRRECEKCEYRFTTYEKLSITRFMVIKSNNEKVPYDRNKLEKSIIKAINKTNVDIWQIEKMLSDLEYEWMKNKQWITAKRIWKDVIDKLKNISIVASIRYASVYYWFQTKEDFIKFISEL